MGLFDKFKGKKDQEEKKANPWIPLTEMSQLDEILENSKTKTQAIFKHSTRCGISSMVMRGFDGPNFPTSEQADVYYLDLLNYRPISMAIQDKFGVVHQSPQLIVVNNGEVTHTASHHDINVNDVLA